MKTLNVEHIYNVKQTASKPLLATISNIASLYCYAATFFSKKIKHYNVLLNTIVSK